MTALSDFTDAFDVFKTAAETFAAAEDAPATVSYDGFTFLLDIAGEELIGVSPEDAEGAVAALAAAMSVYAAANPDVTFEMLDKYRI
jgi:hypothetical protein